MSNRRTITSSIRRALAPLAVGALAWTATAQDVERTARPPVPEMPTEIRGLEVEEHLGDTIPADITFTDSDGKKVRIGDYFKGDKPAVIAMVYYDCPLVCDVLMTKQVDCFNELDLQAGKDFRVLWFSFDPREGTDLAESKRMLYHGAYSRVSTPEQKAELREGWKLHTSDAAAAAALAKALGFKYRQMENGAYNHPVATYVVSPSGKITRYIHGFLLDPRDMKLSLIDASEGKIEASIGDRLMSFCYMLDPKTGKYTLQVFRLMQVAGVLTVTVVGAGIGLLMARDRARRRSRAKLEGAAALAHGSVSVSNSTGLAS